jgi:SAM-dependent methyltransferase
VTASRGVSGDLWDEAMAQNYDRSSTSMFAPEVLEPTVDFLAHRARGGAALEFAVGTGRVALPLHGRGVPVTGLDSSAAMLAQLRAKPGGAELPVVVGDMATTRVGGRFQLVYLVYNTITNLLEQDEQVECFRNAARHLDPGGCFVVEVFVPELRRLPPGEYLRPFALADDYVGVDSYDVVEQRLVSHHYRVGDGGGRVQRSRHRYVWPAELDLMAGVAGLHRSERWGGWREEPFTAASRSHVSVWTKP